MSNITPLSLNADDIDFERYLDDYESKKTSQFVKPIGEFAEEAYEYLSAPPESVGDTLPWQTTWDKFQFRPGELTIWAGVNGNGKSLVMGQTGLWLGSPVVIASMEMQPRITVARMIRQAGAIANPTRQHFDELIAKLQGQVYLYDHVGQVTQESMLGLCHYAAKERGIRHVMIDSLVKCGISTDDYNAQKKFVDRLSQAAKDHDIHVHLVVHIRKGQRETDQPDKFDIKGAGEITDLADNVLIISRNLRKELAVSNGATDLEEEPDGFIRVAKQRNGEWEGGFRFWWNPQAQQWCATSRREPQRVIDGL